MSTLVQPTVPVPVTTAHSHTCTAMAPSPRPFAPGEFRRILNWIGPPGAGLDEATYVPPSPAEIPTALTELERYVHGDTGLLPLLDIALVHYQFEAIHPFLDGNGRIGRLLITLMLIERDLLPEPLLYLSAYFERHRGAYYDHLLAVSQKGEWEGWLLFFLRGVSVEASDASRRAGKLFELRETYRERFQREGARPNLLTATNHLFARPVTNIRELEGALGISFEAARRLVALLRRRRRPGRDNRPSSEPCVRSSRDYAG